jgi:DNA-binding CsgD family transcriptional regulator
MFLMSEIKVLSSPVKMDAVRPGTPVSKREREVLAEVAAGFNNEEIALNLGISNETVKSHVMSARVKLQARNRSHAVALAFSLGLLYHSDE